VEVFGNSRVSDTKNTSPSIIEFICFVFPSVSFLTSSKHVYTTWGRALSISLSTLNKPTDSEQEAFLIAFELIRFGILTANPYSKTYGKAMDDGKRR
jgi:hypothetical protein